MPTPLPPKYGPYALITGASSGLGAEFARQLARHRLNLILVARRRPLLDALSRELRAAYNIHVIVHAADLTSPPALAALEAATRPLDVGLLINNAGVQLHGSFFHPSFADHEQVVALNVVAVARLAYVFGRRFCDRGGGGILFVSSVLRGGVPWFATYAASKSFVSTLAIVLRDEVAARGVDVMVLEPGLVATEMTLAPGQTTHNYGRWLMPVHHCVRHALEAMGRKPVYTPGLLYRFVKWLLDALPTSFAFSLLSDRFKKALEPHLFEYSTPKQPPPPDDPA